MSHRSTSSGRGLATPSRGSTSAVRGARRTRAASTTRSTSTSTLRAAGTALIAAALIATSGALAATASPTDGTWRFDFQQAGGALAPGYTEVTNTTTYSASTGFGFVDTTGLITRDRGAASGPIDREFVGGPDFTFLADVPNGEYTVIATAGDMGASSRTAFTIEGTDFGNFSTASGVVDDHTFEPVVVADGQLTIRMTGNPGRINGIVVLPTLDAPADFAVAGINASTDPGAVTFSWTGDPAFTGYRLYRSTPGGSAAVATDVSGTSYTDATVTIGHTYEYYLVGIDADGRESTPTETLSVTAVDPTITPPAAPTGLAATDVQRNSIALAWTATPGVLSYDVYRSRSAAGPFEFLDRVTSAAYTDSDVLTTVTYYYQVTAVNGGGASAPSATLEIPVATTLVRQAEYLDRAPVAIAQPDGVYVGWRMLGLDPEGIAFHVYRDGTRITTAPLTDSTNLLDSGSAASSTYRVSSVVGGIETWATPEFTPWAQEYLEIALDKPADGVNPDGTPFSYRASDASVGDLDGDGELEIVQIWNPTNAQDNSKGGYTGEVFIDAYTMQGERLWRISMGRNIRAGAHYTQLLVFDFDGDGRSEVMVKTADGTVDGVGQVIGDAAADYRNSSGYVLSGPEFLTVFDGRTGAAIDTVDYVPGRGNVGAWGDTYGNRVDRFLAGVAYLDGEHPSAIFSRGYYTRAVIAAWDFDGAQLTQRWVFDSNASGKQYEGQGNHNLSIADVDGDSLDEIVFGSMTIDDDGSPLYATGLGHGDAMHLSDLDPSREGLEVFAVHESMTSSGNRGATFRDAETGEVLWSIPATRDTGRGAADDIDPRYAGAEGWAVGADAAWNQRTGNLVSAQGELISTSIPAANFLTWWDGDLLREITDHEFDETTRTGVPTVSEWDWETSTQVELERFEGTSSNNDTKGNPVLQADLFGDWREELIFRSEDSTSLRLYSTSALTEYRLRTLMSDPVYRLGVAWQNVAYNQPPHTSYFLGEGMEQPPAPSIEYTNAPTTAPEVVPGPATAAPGRANLSVDDARGNSDGTFTLSMRIPHGQNAYQVIWYVDGQQIGEQLLADQTPNEQTASIEVSGLSEGWHELSAVLVNEHGSTASKTIKVRIT